MTDVLELVFIVVIKVDEHGWKHNFLYFLPNENFCCDKAAQIRSVFQVNLNLLPALTSCFQIGEFFLDQNIEIFTIVFVFNDTVEPFHSFIVDIQNQSLFIHEGVEFRSLERDIKIGVLNYNHLFLEECNFLSTDLILILIIKLRILEI